MSYYKLLCQLNYTIAIIMIHKLYPCMHACCTNLTQSCYNSCSTQFLLIQESHDRFKLNLSADEYYSVTSPPCT